MLSALGRDKHLKVRDSEAKGVGGCISINSR